MRSIPVTRARHVSNFASVLEAKGIPAAGYLARSRLPVDLLESVNDESVLSAIDMLQFTEHAAADTGIGDLGYWAGIAPIEEFGKFGVHVVGAPTLHTAIRAFCGTVITECSAADYHLRYAGSKAWFCHGRAGSDPLQPQHELYALMIMMQVIRLALGPEWKPARISLQRDCEKGIDDNEFLVSTSIEFGATETGIEIDLLEFAKPVATAQLGNIVNGRDTAMNSFSGLPADPLFALRELIVTQLQHQRSPSIEDAAQMAGVSARTLQRQLRIKGTSYSGLVDQARVDIAVPLLIDKSISITKIANQIGYSDGAHFSRAFVRLTGMSPTYFRHSLKDRT